MINRRKLAELISSKDQLTTELADWWEANPLAMDRICNFFGNLRAKSPLEEKLADMAMIGIATIYEIVEERKE